MPAENQSSLPGINGQPEPRLNGNHGAPPVRFGDSLESCACSARDHSTQRAGAFLGIASDLDDLIAQRGELHYRLVLVGGWQACSPASMALTRQIQLVNEMIHRRRTELGVGWVAPPRDETWSFCGLYWVGSAVVCVACAPAVTARRPAHERDFAADGAPDHVCSRCGWRADIDGAISVWRGYIAKGVACG